eukprot:15481605-Alexandrium_andersonii.AAC.1
MLHVPHRGLRIGADCSTGRPWGGLRIARWTPRDMNIPEIDIMQVMTIHITMMRMHGIPAIG